jgi:hypothetical protein
VKRENREYRDFQKRLQGYMQEGFRVSQAIDPERWSFDDKDTHERGEYVQIVILMRKVDKPARS